MALIPVKLNEFKQELLFNFRLLLSGGLLSIVHFRLFWFSPTKGERRGSYWFLSYFYWGICVGFLGSKNIIILFLLYSFSFGLLDFLLSSNLESWISSWLLGDFNICFLDIIIVSSYLECRISSWLLGYFYICCCWFLVFHFLSDEYLNYLK